MKKVVLLAGVTGLSLLALTAFTNLPEKQNLPGKSESPLQVKPNGQLTSLIRLSNFRFHIW